MGPGTPWLQYQDHDKNHVTRGKNREKQREFFIIWCFFSSAVGVAMAVVSEAIGLIRGEQSRNSRPSPALRGYYSRLVVQP